MRINRSMKNVAIFIGIAVIHTETLVAREVNGIEILSVFDLNVKKDNVLGKKIRIKGYVQGYRDYFRMYDLPDDIPEDWQGKHKPCETIVDGEVFAYEVFETPVSFSGFGSEKRLRRAIGRRRQAMGDGYGRLMIIEGFFDHHNLNKDDHELIVTGPYNYYYRPERYYYGFGHLRDIKIVKIFKDRCEGFIDRTVKDSGLLN